MSVANLVALLRRRYAPDAPDADLLRTYIASRDEAAFRRLVARHGPLVLRLCRRLLGDVQDAEDAFQATFLVLARRAGSVRRPEALGTWLYGIARRICRNARVARDRRRAAEARALPRAMSGPADDLSARELLEVLDDELHCLPRRYQEPLHLVFWQGLTQADAARRLCLTFGALHGRLERGRAKLAARLERRGFTPGDLRPLLAAPLGATPVPANLLAATIALAADPWSKAVPAAVLVLAAAGPSKLVTVGVMGMLLAGALALAGGGLWRAGSVSDRRIENEETFIPPVAHAPGSPDEQPEPPRVDRYGDPLPPGALLRLGALRYRAGGAILQLAKRPTSRQVAVCTETAVIVMEIDSGKIIHSFARGTRVIEGIQAWVMFTALALAPDGRTFAVGSQYANRSAPFWLHDAVTGERLREFAGHDERVEALAFLGNGQQIASFGEDGLIRVWDIATATKLRELRGPDRKLTSFAALLDGRTLAAGAEARDGTAAVYLWETASGRLLRTLVGHTADVRALAFAPDGRTLVSGGNATVRLWDVATGHELRQFLGHAKLNHAKTLASIHSLAFSPDGRTLASASTDGTARAWTVATGQALDDFDWFTGASSNLAFAADHTLMIGGSPMLLLRDVSAREFKNREIGATYHVTFVGYAPDGRTIATTDPNGTTCLWDAADGRNLVAKHWSQLSAFTFVSSDGRRTGFTEMIGEEFIPCVGDATTGQVIRRLPESNRLAMVMSPDGRRLVTGLAREPKSPEEAKLHIWDTTTGVKLGQLPAVETSIMTVVLSPDGRFVFTGEGRDPPYRLRQWDVATGRPVKEFRLPDNIGVRSLAVSRGGRRLAGLADDNRLRVWDVVTGQECLQFKPVVGDPQVMMSFSPDGTMLAIGGGGVELWDTRTGQRLATLPGDMGVVFSPDSRRLVAGCGDGTALVWDVEAAISRKVPPFDDARQSALWDALAGDSLATYAIDCWQAAPQAAVPFLRRKLPDADERRCERAVEILEAIATPDARALLEDLAKGDPAARLTREAKASLERLRRR